jgi:hypothetical protein
MLAAATEWPFPCNFPAPHSRRTGVNDVWATISATASAATGALGSTLQSLGSNAASVATAAPQALTTVAGGPAHMVQNLAVVEKPMSAVAKAARSSAVITGASRFLSKALPITAVVASSVRGAQIVQRQGVDALVNTQAGREASIGALGGALFLVPAAPVQLAAAGVLGVGAANHFGAFEFLDEPPEAVRRSSKRRT